jgi:hypothetical protein
VPLVTAQLARLPGSGPGAARCTSTRAERTRASALAKPPPQSSFEVRNAPAPQNQKKKKKQQRPPTNRPQQPRTVASGLTAPKPKAWIKKLVDTHAEPGRPRPRVANPARAAGASIPDWMFDESDLDDD